MARDDAQPKIGAGHAEAMFRQGLAELRNALYPGSNVAQPATYGLYGTKTPGEVAEARKPEERDLDEEPRSVVNEHVKQAEEASRDVRERDSREPERE